LPPPNYKRNVHAHVYMHLYLLAYYFRIYLFALADIGVATVTVDELISFVIIPSFLKYFIRHVAFN